MQFQQMYKNHFKGSIFTLHTNVEVAPYSNQQATLKLPHTCSLQLDQSTINVS
jgi:hypothetical protein